MQKDSVAFSELIPDDRNANRGSKRGAALIKKSLKDYGAGRSILLDKNNRVIAGNKTLEQASGKTGIKGVRVIETDGTELPAVRRTDLDLKLDARAKSLAIADNRAGEVSLEWDPEILKVLDAEVDLSQFWAADELEELLGQAGNQLLTDEDEVPPVPKKAKTKPGQIYELGDHRLMCGDSTSNTDVQRLLGPGQAAPNGHRPAVRG